MRAHSGLLATLALLFVLTGCPEEGPLCADGEVHDTVSGDCIPIDFDAGPMDAGPNLNDAGADGGGDAGPCGACPTERPICNSDGPDPECVECVASPDCSASTIGSLCETSSGRCVECLMDSDCSDPEAAQCSGGACVPCSSPDHCAGVNDATLCDTDRTIATCVECTQEDSAACETISQTCNLVSGACVDVPPGDLDTCDACTNDLQCAATARCVPMDYGTEPHGAGGYCLPIFVAGGCVRPYAVMLTDRTSLNETSPRSYCGISEARTTCEAVQALDAAVTCSTAGGCPEAGRCELVGGEMRCTIACAGTEECLAAVRTSGNSCTGGSSPNQWCI